MRGVRLHREERVGVAHGLDSGVRNRIKAGNIGLHAHVESDKGSLVAYLVAVVRGAENCDQAIVGLILIAELLHLVRSNYHSQSIVVKEAMAHVGAEGKSDAALGRATARLRLRVCPQNIGHEALLRRLAETIDLLHVLKLDTVLGEQASVNDKNLLCSISDNMTKRESIENFLEELVNSVGVLCLDLSFEPVHLVHAAAFVIATC